MDKRTDVKIEVPHGPLDIVDRIRIFDRNLYVMYNMTTGCYEVHDRAAPGGPKHSMVMRVMNPDGSPRPLDQRTLNDLMEHRPERMKMIFAELEQHEINREERWQARTDALADALADDIQWAGKRVVTSVESAKRTKEAMNAGNELRTAARAGTSSDQ